MKQMKPLEKDSSSPKRTASDKALEYLKDLIITRKIPHESFINEAEIAGALGMSRGPVRKSLLTLESEGLVEILQNGRAKVLSLSETYLSDMFDLRLLLEKMAIDRIIQSAYTDFVPLMSTFNRMKRISDTALSDEEMSDQDKKVLVRLDYRFHSSVMTISGNRALFNAWKTMTPLMQTLMLQNIDKISLEIEEHQRLLDSILKKDPASLQYLTGHLMNAKESLLKYFRSLK